MLDAQKGTVYQSEWKYKRLSEAKGKGKAKDGRKGVSVDVTSRVRSRSRERSLKGGDGKKGRCGYQGGKRK